MKNSILVGWMYPDLLNLHGERGNAKCLKTVAEKMGVDLEIERIDNLDEKIDFEKYDILLFNAGELRVIKAVIFELNTQKDALQKYIEENKVIFVTGTSIAIFADKITRLDGKVTNGLNILNMDVKERSMVLGDDLYYKIDEMEIMSSQIQMIDVTLKDAEALGKIEYGYGNIGDKKEGAKYKNVIATNALGPVLVKNPWYAERLIKEALKNKNIEYTKKNMEYELETKSLESIKEFIIKKVNGETIH